MPKVERIDTFDDLEYQDGAEGSREVDATEVREFTIGGKSYRTYLCEGNAKLFDADQAKWTRFAEPVTRSSGAPRRTSPASGSATGPRRDRTHTANVREWARGQQFEPPVSERGRIPDHVTEAYYAAHPDERRPEASAA